MHREFGDAGTLGTIEIACFGLAVIMAEHGGTARPGQRCDNGNVIGHARAAIPDRGHQGDVIIQPHMRPLGTGIHLGAEAWRLQIGDGVGIDQVEGPVMQRDGRVQQGRAGVIIEGEGRQIGAAQGFGDQGQGFGAKGFPAQLDAVVGRQPRPQAIKPVQHIPARLDRAQARLPAEGQGMIGRGDAIGGQLAIGFKQGGFDGDRDAGAWHDLAFERIAVHIDKGRTEQAPTPVDHGGAVAGGIDAGDPPRFDADRGALYSILEDDMCAVDLDCLHHVRSASRCQCHDPGFSWGRSSRDSGSKPSNSVSRSRALQK